ASFGALGHVPPLHRTPCGRAKGPRLGVSENHSGCARRDQTWRATNATVVKVGDPRVSPKAGSESISVASSSFGANEWLVDELYQQYLKDKNAVDPAWWDFVADSTPGENGSAKDGATTEGAAAPSGDAAEAPAAEAPKQAAPAQEAPTQKAAPATDGTAASEAVQPAREKVLPADPKINPANPIATPPTTHYTETFERPVAHPDAV